ncbi:MAG: DNA-3-methyladenine glycosylase I [Pseudomonadales bacterium]
MREVKAGLNRCDWCGEDPAYVRYHDEEWGVPQRESQRLFELLVLEGAQAGLSWITILRKREGYRLVFDGFVAETLAAWPDERLEAALRSTQIVRNRLKVLSVRQNALAIMDLQKAGATLSDYLWEFIDHQPLVNQWLSHNEVPAQTDLSIRISKDMKKRGFTFVGPTIIYAFMQATGMVNDHVVSCFRHRECMETQH